MLDHCLTQEQLEQVYNWVDELPLSRPKKNMSRDFSDAVLFAQMIAHFNPRIVELHNYVAAGAVPQKLNNWKTLNRKVLPKVKVSLRNQEMQSLANSTPGAIEILILRLKKSIQNGELPSPSLASRASKTNTSLSLGFSSANKPKAFNKMSYKQIKNKEQVAQLISSKDDEIKEFKQHIGLLVAKAGKLEEVLKSKDRQIEEMVCLIKQKK